MLDFTRGVNTNSGPQLIKYLYETLAFDEVTVKRGGRWVADRTPGNKPKTDVDTLARLKARTKKQEEFLALYRRETELGSMLTKYLNKFIACCEENNGHLQATLNQPNTGTHRLSSSGLRYKTQFQNFFRPFKVLFKARKDGWLVGEADGAQLEFRVESDKAL
jgi:DNA polymerase I-like protein with 3'-5' exonuclease and polymerase domains